MRLGQILSILIGIFFIRIFSSEFILKRRSAYWIIIYKSYFWSYELIREHTCLASLTLGRLDLIIHSPCPGWSPCSTAGFWSTFKRSKPSLAPFLKSWWHPSTTSVAFLLDINFRWIYNPLPFSSTTIENCPFHNFSIIITERDFSIGLSSSHFLISTFI